MFLRRDFRCGDFAAAFGSLLFEEAINGVHLQHQEQGVSKGNGEDP